jgi:CRP-like cAMP-binding protein
MSLSLDDLRRNRLLALIQPDVQQVLLPLLKMERMEVGDTIYPAGSPISTLYFPLSAVFSNLKTMEDGRRVEIATVGKEGFLGIPVLLESREAPIEVIAQIDGEAISLSVPDFGVALQGSAGELRRILLRYTQVTLNQVAQNLACNRFHRIDARCARWLLMTQDRVQRDAFNLADDFLGYMLAAPRDRVIAAKDTLTQARLLHYVGAKIRILDREGLEMASCECYGTIKHEEDTFLRSSD